MRSLFSYHDHGREFSPFLLLDYAGETLFPPSDKPRGVGAHPHRGFETVTIVYKGEVAHRDSTGQSGVIGAGDVQWMTAGGGILHEELHSPAFTREGGALEMAQLWVNLPAKDKMTAPRYQAIASSSIPVVTLPEDAGTLRVIAGVYEGHQGPAQTFSPLHVWDIRLNAGAVFRLSLPEGWNVALPILQGNVTINEGAKVHESQVAVLGREEKGVVLSAQSDTVLLLLSGEPLDEPVVGHGPFVMNTAEEIAQAIDDFNSGRFGRMAG